MFKREDYYNIALKELGINKVIFGGDLNVLTDEEKKKLNLKIDLE